MKIERIIKPDLQQYKEAMQFSGDFLGHIITPIVWERYEVLQQLGVELILASEKDRIFGVCFVLPDEFTGPQGVRGFVWLFGMIATPEAKNIGALMLFKIMNWYPAIMCIGVTEIAAKLYQALRWKKYDRIWRCVHPIKLRTMVNLFHQRIAGSGWMPLIKVVAWVYDLLVSPLLSLISYRFQVEKVASARSELVHGTKEQRKVNLVATYSNVIRMTDKKNIIEVVESDKAGRIVRDDFSGWKRLLIHLQLWKAIKKQDVIYTEYIVTSERDSKQAICLGYLPLKMPIYYWDKTNLLCPFFSNLEGSTFNFASCDKIL